MRIADVIFSVGVSGYFHMDFAAIRSGARPNGFTYDGAPATPGFSSIVQPAPVISIQLLLEDGQVAIGDCADVVFAGASGRDHPLVAEEQLRELRGAVAERLRGCELGSFKPLAETFDGLALDHEDGRLHMAVRYGLTQALLHGVALSRHETMAEVIAGEYATILAKEPIAIAASCEPEDWRQLDRMILKGASPLPHAYFTDLDRDVGRHGERFASYAERVARRVREIGDPDYRPLLHFDMYGTLGELFENDADAVASYLAAISDRTGGLTLLIESPLLGRARAEQIELMGKLRSALRRRRSSVLIVADDWCNTIEDIAAFTEAKASDFVQIKMPDLGGINNTIAAVVLCKAKGMGAYLGGSANETEQSARVSAHIALATGPAFVSAKPGLGGDEGVMIQRNEMMRTLALIAHRKAAAPRLRQPSGGRAAGKPALPERQSA